MSLLINLSQSYNYLKWGFKVGAVRSGGVFNTAPININANKNAMKLSGEDASFNVGDKNIRINKEIDLSKRGIKLLLLT